MRFTWLAFALALSCGSDAPGSGEEDPQNPYTPYAYIRGDIFRRLVLEIDSVPGFEPRSSVEDDLLAGLGPILDKPLGISSMRDDALTSMGADHVWTFDELDDLAKATFDLPVSVDTTRMHVLFVDGSYEKDTASSKILGIAWGGKNLVMFKQTIENLCQQAPLLIRERVCEAAELGIWTHETGHLLGLVDNGLPMVSNHRDPDSSHGRHDASDDCIMYWAYEGQSIIDLFRDRFLGGNDAGLGFDQACLADIAAVRDAP
jgi:hypothetical protein